MKRLKGLNLYQKAVLILMAAMVLIFTVVYPKTIAREGFAYKNTILVPSYEKDGTVYSGKIQGKQAVFTVSADKTVEFQYGDKTYGPYSAKEDPTAIPEDSDYKELMIGVELRRGDKIIFRGGVLKLGDFCHLYNEDGSLENMVVSVSSSFGNVMDEDGNVIDQMEPSALTILDLIAGPELTHKGYWGAWLGGIAICILTAISILYADELFRWNLSFRIRNVDRAEPSEWEIAGRYIGWTVLPIAAMIIFITGLQ